MAGLVPAIHDLPAGWKKDVDARVIRREDGAEPVIGPRFARTRWRLLPGHDDLRVMRFLSYSLKAVLIALPAAIICFLASGEPAYADLKICNRMSYVVEAAIGIDDKSATATRGWFRIDPAACRVVVQGTLTADRILLNARALGLYGSSPIPQNGSDTLCVAPGEFRHRRGPPVPRRTDAGAVYPDHADDRPTTAIWWPISPRTANMTTSRRGSPAFSGCW